MLKLVLITGISGSGKSLALRVLEDASYTCIDNLPVRFLQEFIASTQETGISRVAVAIDVRSPGDLNELPAVLANIKKTGVDLRVIFLDASDHTLRQRYSESRRRHPLTERLQQQTGTLPSLQYCIDTEREMLAALREKEHVIDTTQLAPAQLRRWVLTFAQAQPVPIILTFESFAFKRGIPGDADLMFDVRCLPNPHYERELKPLTGADPAVAQWLSQYDTVRAMVNDISGFIERWLPVYAQDTRSYLTVAIGCTGGQHRSVYVAEQLVQRFHAYTPLLRHRNQPQLTP